MRAHRFSQSAMIDRIGFDDDLGILSISFRDTGTYLYYDVPAETMRLRPEASSMS
jgi:hypothetical protein